MLMTRGTDSLSIVDIKTSHHFDSYLKMKFTSIVLLASLLSAVLASPVAEDKPVARLAPNERVSTVEARDADHEDLTRRTCTYNGCKCQVYPYTPKNGVYCANCGVAGWPGYYVVWDLGKGGSTNHVYQCNTKGGCCDYGYANDCASGINIRCGA